MEGVIQMVAKKFDTKDVRQAELLLNKYGCGVWLYDHETGFLEYTATQGGRKNPLPGDNTVMTLAEGLRLVFDIIKSRQSYFDKDTEKIQRMLGSYRQTWTMWVLSDGDIQYVWGKMYPDAPGLTDDQMNNVAERFREGFENSQDNWSDTLREAIEEEIPKPEEV